MFDLYSGEKWTDSNLLPLPGQGYSLPLGPPNLIALPIFLLLVGNDPTYSCSNNHITSCRSGSSDFRDQLDFSLVVPPRIELGSDDYQSPARTNCAIGQKFQPENSFNVPPDWTQMVWMEGIEPPTPGSSGECSTN